MYSGVIASIERSKGYGFIEADDGEKIFFHQRWLRKVRFKDLHEGDEVVFTVNMGRRGPRAYNLNLAENEANMVEVNRGDRLFKD